MPSGSSAKYLVTVSAHGTTKVCELDARMRERGYTGGGGGGRGRHMQISLKTPISFHENATVAITN